MSHQEGLTPKRMVHGPSAPAILEKQNRTLSDHQKLFLQSFDIYGDCDVGLLFTFFMNVIKCNPGDAFICYPDEPHAYI